MNKVRIYLAGTIYKEKPDSIWKSYFKSLLDIPVHGVTEYEFFDPDPQNEPEKYMIARDKAEIEKADIFVAYIERPSFGTAMEIMYCNILMTKPVFIINPSGSVKKDLWVSGHADLICSSCVECADHIRTIRF